MKKTILLATFLPLNKLEWFISFLAEHHHITIDKLFIFKNKNDNTYIITFKIELDSDIRINFKKEYPFSTPIHKKGNTLYTINALNKLIESKNDTPIGNVDYKSFIIDWSEYNDKIILVNDNILIINDLERIFL